MMPTPVNSFGVACPKCGAGYGNNEKPAIRIDVNDLSEVECGECNETFAADAAAKVASDNARRWAAVAKLVEKAKSIVRREDWDLIVP